MKNIFTLPLLRILRFYFVCSLGLCLFLGCGDIEDKETEATDPFNSIVTPNLPVDSLQETEPILLGVKSIYKQLTSREMHIPLNWETEKDPVLRAAYTRFLLSRGKIDIPPNWHETTDPILHAEYERAQLIRQFGDIPQVHIRADFHLLSPLGVKTVTRETFIAYFEAQYFLFPNEVNRRALEDAKKPEPIGGLELDKLRKEDPEAWAKRYRAQLIAELGDTPQVKVVADFIRKLELGLPRTDAECHTFLQAYSQMRDLAAKQEFIFPLDEEYAFLEAQDQLKIKVNELTRLRLTQFRKAKAEGIPFHLMDRIDDNA
ncbi:MAG: hypothetical protein OXG97_16010 [Candidatus Poribacteria bacterium]|nr:hypothetical protein [Candidatus Poribacteria bacterium]